MKKKILVIVNAFAHPIKARRMARNLTSFLTNHSLEFEVMETTRNTKQTVVDHLDETFTDLIIIGGDGTVNEVVNGLKHDIPIAIIPSGTGNDFIKNIEIGKTVKEQFKTAIEGKIRHVDLGICNDRKFVNGVGIGFDGQIVEDMFSKRVPLLKGHAAYYYHVLRILAGYRERAFDYQIDGSKIQKELILLTVANGTTFGGGFQLTPDARIDDGLLAVCEIGRFSPIKRFMNIHKLSNGTHDTLSSVRFHQARKVKIEKNLLLYAHIDGERMGRPPFDIQILPGALKIRTH
ncbi:MAG: diacylglycerol kinase family protein [Bacteroidota bacterium]